MCGRRHNADKLAHAQISGYRHIVLSPIDPSTLDYFAGAIPLVWVASVREVMSDIRPGCPFEEGFQGYGWSIHARPQLVVQISLRIGGQHLHTSFQLSTRWTVDEVRSWACNWMKSNVDACTTSRA